MNKSFPIFLAIGLLLMSAISMADEAAPIRLLIFGGGTHHEFGKCSGALIDYLRSQGGVIASYSEDPESLRFEHLKLFNVLLLNCCLCYPNPPDPAYKLPSPQHIPGSLTQFVENGGGLICAHSSIASFSDWGKKIDLMGGIWDWNKSKHDAYQKMVNQVVAPDHPIVKGLPNTFEFPDEFYHTLTLLPTSKILIEAPHEKEGKQVTEPLAWIAKDTEKERVVTIVLGHDMASWGNPAFQQLMKQAVEWAARRR